MNRWLGCQVIRYILCITTCYCILCIYNFFYIVYVYLFKCMYGWVVCGIVGYIKGTFAWGGGFVWKVDVYCICTSTDFIYIYTYLYNLCESMNVYCIRLIFYGHERDTYKLYFIKCKFSSLEMNTCVLWVNSLTLRHIISILINIYWTYIL